MKKQNLMIINSICGDGGVRAYHPMWQLTLTNFHEAEPIVRRDFLPHVHTLFELIVPVGPQYRCQLDYRELAVPSGNFLLIQPGQHHIDHLSPEERFLCMHFNLRPENSSSLLKQLFVPGLPPEKQIAPIPFPGVLSDLLDLSVRHRKEKLPQFFFDQIFLSVLQLFLGAYPAGYLLQNPDQETGRGQTYYRIYRYFESCIARGRFSVRDFCANMKCSSRTLNRICNEYFYSPPHRAFQNYRMNCTLRYLLENPGVSVKEVSARFHYPNPFYYSRLFRKRFGFAPSRARYELDIHASDEKNA